MPEALNIDAVRMPIRALSGDLASFRPDDLAALALKAIANRTGINPAIVEKVYLGCANQVGCAIRAGEGDVFIAGGVGSMQRTPNLISEAERASGFGIKTARDSTLGWSYPNPRMVEMRRTVSMGETAENIYEVTYISREDQEE